MTPTPEAIARGITRDWEAQLTIPISEAACLDLEQRIALALAAWDDRPREPEACRVPEARGLHVGFPRQGGRAPDGGMPPRTP